MITDSRSTMINLLRQDFKDCKTITLWVYLKFDNQSFSAMHVYMYHIVLFSEIFIVAVLFLFFSIAIYQNCVQ